MPRNGSGQYNLPVSNPVTSGTTIASTWANNTMADLGNEISNSLPVDGQRPMLAPIKEVDGSAVNPAFTFSSETTSGLYRAGTNDIRIAVQAGSVAQFTTTGLNSVNIGATTAGTGAFTTLAASGATTLAGTLTASGAVQLNTTLNVNGAATVGGAFGVTGLAAFGSTVSAVGSISASAFVGSGSGLTGIATGLTAGSTFWTGVSGTPTTTGGYGITNAITTAGGNISTGTLNIGKQSVATTSTNVAPLVVTNLGGPTGDGGVAAMSFAAGTYGINMYLRHDGYFGLGGWSSSAWRWYSDPTGNMTASGDVTAYSDPRLKRKIKPILNALDKIDTLDGVNFVWKKKKGLGKAGKADVGVLADQVQAVMPEAVHTSGIEIDGEKYDMVAYDKLIPLLIQGIKELRKEVNTLKASKGA